MTRTLFLLFLLPVFATAQPIKNLDIKNGFLQFKLGDSISHYTAVLHNHHKATLNEYEVMDKAIGLKHKIDKLTLTAENGIITKIEVYMQGEEQVQFMDDAMKKAYGEGSNENGNDTIPGRHTTYLLWLGKKVSAIAKKQKIDFRSVNGIVRSVTVEHIFFRKTGDLKIEGALSADFPL